MHCFLLYGAKTLLKNESYTTHSIVKIRLNSDILSIFHCVVSVSNLLPVWIGHRCIHADDGSLLHQNDGSAVVAFGFLAKGCTIKPGPSGIEWIIKTSIDSWLIYS